MMSYSAYLSCDTLLIISSSMITPSRIYGITNSYLASFFNLTSLASSFLGGMYSIENIISNKYPRVSSTYVNFIVSLGHPLFYFDATTFGDAISAILLLVTTPLALWNFFGLYNTALRSLYSLQTPK
jgi:hypothetical protein